MADESAEDIAYNEAVRALEGQSRMVDELRSRTGLLLAGASVVTSLLVTPALETGSLDALSGAGLLAFAGVVFCCITIVLPRRLKWRFSLGAQILVEDWVDEPKSGDVLAMKNFLALTLGNNFEKNQSQLENLYRWFTAAATLLGIEILALTLRLA